MIMTHVLAPDPPHHHGHSNRTPHHTHQHFCQPASRSHHHHHYPCTSSCVTFPAPNRPSRHFHNLSLFASLTYSTHLVFPLGHLDSPTCELVWHSFSFGVTLLRYNYFRGKHTITGCQCVCTAASYPYIYFS